MLYSRVCGQVTEMANISDKTNGYQFSSEYRVKHTYAQSSGLLYTGNRLMAKSEIVRKPGAQSG